MTRYNQTRAVKDAPLGWKWCSCCGDTKKLDEFGVGGGKPPRTMDTPNRYVDGSRWTARNRRPQSICKTCVAVAAKGRRDAKADL